jgi:hypothetical protein
MKEKTTVQTCISKEKNASQHEFPLFSVGDTKFSFKPASIDFHVQLIKYYFKQECFAYWETHF